MPSPPTDLQPIIIARATELFRQHGFAATSVKQIADAAGCTKAALYYYFPEGKNQIMREVVRRSLQSVDQLVDVLGGATDLPQFFERLTRIVGDSIPGIAQDLRWLTLEFPRLPLEDQQFVHERFFILHRAIAGGMERLSPTSEKPSQLAWLIICAFFGYEQLFLETGLSTDTTPSLHEFGQMITSLMTRTP